MRIQKNDVPIKINVPGALARQKTDFGDEQTTEQWVQNTLRWMRGRILLPCFKDLKMTFATHPIGDIS